MGAPRTTTSRPGGRVAIVLPGGGARGAYEVGALSVLLPELERRGEMPTIFCGTSVGAINATYLASAAHQSAAEQVEHGLAEWRSLRKSDVIRNVIGPGLPRTLMRFVGDALELPGVRLAALMDPRPLRNTLRRMIDWEQLSLNAREGAFDALCVVATSLARSGPVAFVQGGATMPVSQPADALQYVRVDEMDPQHVRASAAIPMLFAPVRVDHPAEFADYYVDGATRLNTPLAPALSLGADRVVVIGFEPLGRRAHEPDRRPMRVPRIADVLSNIVDGLLVDQINDDLHQLFTVNAMIAARGRTARASRTVRSDRGRPAYRTVEYALVSPRRRGELGELAEEVLDRRYSGWRGVLNPDFPVMSRLLGAGRARSRGELLSFLLFDDLYFDLLIEAGQRDAQDWVSRHEDFWCSDPGHDFDFDTGRTTEVAGAAATEATSQPATASAA
ncbi:MAG: patatin-like phospholipase family protein [Solirubrobacteraceae bacterium]|nr:patatin-like phospholipase family protein [Solirubrobacteraceae bacterium]